MKVNIKNPKISTSFKTERVYPELEDLEVTPTTEEQNFKSSKYGFDNVTVKRIETEKLNVTPSIEEQVNEGLYSKVTVAGDSNFIEDNIKEGITLWGKTGTAKTTSAKITDAKYLFYQGTRTDYLHELLNLCNGIIDMTYMFYSDTNIKIIPYFNTSEVKDMTRAFAQCSNLVSVPEFDASKVENINGIFYFTNIPKYRYFTTLGGFKNLGKAYTQKTNNYSIYKLELSNCANLTHESLMNVINNLYDLNLTYNVANGGTLYTQSLVLGSTNISKLSAEEIALATAKRLDCILKRRK